MKEDNKIQYLNSITFTVTSILSKSTRHVESQENVIHHQEENSSIETNAEMTGMMEFADKDFMIDIIKIINILINLEDDLNLMRRETEAIKKNKRERREVKNTIPGMKTSHGIKRILGTIA